MTPPVTGGSQEGERQGVSPTLTREEWLDALGIEREIECPECGGQKFLCDVCMRTGKLTLSAEEIEAAVRAKYPHGAHLNMMRRYVSVKTKTEAAGRALIDSTYLSLPALLDHVSREADSTNSEQEGIDGG